MFARFLPLAAFAALSASFSPACLAQLVVVQPGYVQAPFVRVYTNPDGSSRVRAPFVDVYSPPRRPMPFYRNGQFAPTAQSVGELDWDQLRNVIVESAAELDSRLSRFPTGEVWRTHFKTRRIAALMAPAKQGPPTPEEQAALVEILQTYEASTNSADLRSITSLPAFLRLHAALLEFSQPVAARTQSQLATSYADLFNSLGRLKNGAGWQAYLALPESAFEEVDKAGDPVQIAAITESLDRYESVNREEKYQGIARRESFQATRRRLQAYINLLATEAPAQKGPMLEELPIPKPEPIPAPRR